VKIVSVGNLSVGGTGKTPTVLELAKFLTKRGYKVSVLLRGYKRKTKGTRIVSNGENILMNVYEAGDEAFLYAKLLKGIPVVVSENRCKGAELIVERFKPDVILLDDALQHLRIERDFDVVLLTPRDLKDRVLPFGRLREPLSVLKLKGNYCLLTKTDGNPALEEFCQRLNKPFGYLRVKGYRLVVNPDVYSSEGDDESPTDRWGFELLKGKTVGVVSALGDNASFFKAIETLAERYDFKPVRFLSFPDHYHYRGVKLEKNLVWLTTFKDYFKLRENFDGKLMVVDRIVELPRSLKEKILTVVERRKEENVERD